MIFFISGMVVVSRADNPTISGFNSATLLTNSSVLMLIPKSVTSNPTPRNMVTTIFLPISCKSPRTVPTISLPLTSFFSFARNGSRTLSASFMARAESKTSGMKTSPVLNFPPITSMVASMPRFKISLGLKPLSSISCTWIVIVWWFPCMTSCWIVLKSSSSGTSEATRFAASSISDAETGLRAPASNGSRPSLATRSPRRLRRSKTALGGVVSATPTIMRLPGATALKKWSR